MIKIGWVWLIAVALSLIAGSASASVRGGLGISLASSVACPQGLGLGDGCPGNGGLFTQPNFFTYAAQSGQTYTTRPPWNLVGVDYGTGITVSVGSLVDPAVAFPTGQQVTHSGCQYLSSGGLLGPRIDCTLTADVTFSGIDLSGVRFGHACTDILIHNGMTFNATFNNIYFEMDPTCLNALNGAVTGNPIMIGVGGSTSTGNFTITNSTAIGHGADLNGWCPGNNSSTCVTNGHGSLPEFFSVTTSGTMDAEYNEFLQWPGHTFGMSGTGTCSASTAVEIVSHNYQDSNHLRVPMGHGAFGSFGCSSTQTYAYNTLLWSNTGATLEASLTTMLSGSPNSSAVGTWTIDHNTVIANLVGGTSRTTITGTYHLDGTSGALTIDSASGTFIPGMSMNGTGQFQDVYLWQELSGFGGVGSTWAYDCGANGIGVLTSVCAWSGGTTNNPGVYNTVQTPTFISTNSLGGAGASGTITADPRLISTTVFGLVHGPFTTVNVTTNYADNTGGSSANDTNIMDTGSVAAATSCVNPIVPTGNINLVSGAAMNGNVGSGPGC